MTETPTLHRAWDALSVEFRGVAIPALRMVDQLLCAQDPEDGSRVIPCVLMTPADLTTLHPEADGRLRASLRFTVKDAVLPQTIPTDTVRLLIYPRDPSRLTPMWRQRVGEDRANCSCGLPWAWCHVVGPHHHTLRSRDFEEAWTATGQPTPVNGHA